MKKSDEKSLKTFEDYLNRIQEIEEALSKEDTPLDRTVHLYQEGVELIRKCEAIIQNAKLQVETIQNEENRGNDSD